MHCIWTRTDEKHINGRTIHRCTNPECTNVCASDDENPKLKAFCIAEHKELLQQIRAQAQATVEFNAKQNPQPEKPCGSCGGKVKAAIEAKKQELEKKGLNVPT